MLEVLIYHRAGLAVIINHSFTKLTLNMSEFKTINPGE